MKKIKHILLLLRIQNLFIATLVILVATIILNNTEYEKFLLCVLIVISTMGFGNVFNDLLDLENDKINHPERILPSNKISIYETKIIISVCLLIALGAALFIHFKALLLLYFYILPLLYFYNTHIKNTPFFGNIIIAQLLALVFIFTEIVLTGSYGQLIIPTMLAFGISLIRELIKDLADIDGDLKSKRKTLPICIGPNLTKYFVILLICIFNMVCFFPYIYNYYQINYLISVIILVEIPLIISLFLFINKTEKKTFIRVANITKYITIAGLFVLLIANLGD